nr:CRISPR-associated endoribonuclease Cas6 [uncultured Blautia sp.]
MNVFEIRIKFFLLRDIPLHQAQTKIAAFLDKGFLEEEELARFHKENRYKNYSFNYFFPLEKDGKYKKGRIYTITVRTIDKNLAHYFSETCANIYTEEMKGLTAEIRMIPQKHIECLYTVTTAVLKDSRGYWRNYMSLSEFGERLKINLIKKWNQFENEKLEEDFPFYTMIEFSNKVPIAMEYKNIKLLGDKFCIYISDHPTAQKLAHMAIATGLLEMNSRGAGSVNYRWL